MSKRIGVFSLAYIPLVGGAELAIKEITDRLPVGELEFKCFTHKFEKNWRAEELVGNVGVVRVGKGSPSTSSGQKSDYGFLQKFLYVWRAWRAAERAHKEKPFDMIWAMMAAYGGLAALLFKLRHPNIPMLLTLQEGDSEEHILRRVGFFYPLWKLIFKKADYIQTISNYLADFARRHGARAPIEVVPNGTNTGIMKQEVESRGDRIIKIITTSRLVHKNAIDILIRSAAILKTMIHNSSFMIQILGAGPDEEKLKNLATELDVADRVEWFGHVEPEKIYEYLALADVFVRASRSEGLGSSFLEAMAVGLPIIGTPVGGIPDFLKNGETGLFCKVDDPEDLAEKIKLLLTNEALCQKIARNGQKLVQENYAWGKISEKMKQIFLQLGD